MADLTDLPPQSFAALLFAIHLSAKHLPGPMLDELTGKPPEDEQAAAAMANHLEMRKRIRAWIVAEAKELAALLEEE